MKSRKHNKRLMNFMSFQNGTVKCEEDTAWLRCNEYKHISIISAFWGRRNFGLCTEHTGSLLTNKYCPTLPKFLTKVKDACEGTTMCEVRATKAFFGDTSCYDVYKYLEVYYKCIEVINGHEVVNEDNLLNANFLGQVLVTPFPWRTSELYSATMYEEICFLYNTWYLKKPRVFNESCLSQYRDRVQLLQQTETVDLFVVIYNKIPHQEHYIHAGFFVK